ncbi:MAG: hypothetical protein ACI30W_00075 [Muribaculaceae bacterium]
MTTPLTRWRTSLGFGVHSPFAFRFIREVLRERHCAYYAYTDIAADISKAPHAAMPLRRALLLYRVIIDLQPRAAYVDHTCPAADIAAMVLHHAAVPLVSTAAEADFYFGLTPPPVQPLYTYLFAPDKRRHYSRCHWAVPHLRGQVFINARGTIIAVNKPSFFSKTYKIWF